MWYTCVQCGKKFELSEAEKDFYEEKNLSLPKLLTQVQPT